MLNFSRLLIISIDTADVLILVLLFAHQCADLVFDLRVQIFEDFSHEVTVSAGTG